MNAKVWLAPVATVAAVGEVPLLLPQARPEIHRIMGLLTGRLRVRLEAPSPGGDEPQGDR